MKIRKAIKSDTAELSRLYYKLSEDHFIKEKFIDTVPKFNTTIDVYAEKITSNNMVIFVAEDHGKVCGYVEMLLREQDDNFLLGNYTYLMHAYIETDQRGYRIARRLFKACEDYSKECGINYMLVDVFSHNSRVQDLVKHFGMDEYRMCYLKNFEVG